MPQREKKKIIASEELLPSLQDPDSFLGSKDKYTFFIAKTAEEALKLHDTVGADIIVIDLDLPVMGGDAMCTAIRAQETCKRSYIALICSGRKADVERCGLAGANNYLRRPLTSRQLFNRLHMALGAAQRQHKRILLRVSVLSTCQSESFYCTSRDLSGAGMLIETDKALARGDMLVCSFFLPDHDRIETKGRVVRVSKSKDEDAEGKFLYGVEFSDLSESALNIINAFLQQQIEDEQQDEED